MAENPCDPGRENPPDVEDLFPPGTAPEDRVIHKSSLCSLGMHPLLLEGAIRDMLIQHFADPKNITNPHVRKKLARKGGWKPTPDTGIYIETISTWKPEQTEQRPALIIKSGNFQYQRLGIGDLKDEDIATGRHHYEALWNGGLTVFAVGKEAGETMLLARAVLEPLGGFAPLLVQELNLKRFMPIQIGELAVLEDSNDDYLSQVDFSVAYTESWWIEPEAPRWKSVWLDPHGFLP